MFPKTLRQQLILLASLNSLWAAIVINFNEVSYNILDHAVMERLDLVILEHRGRNTLNGSFMYRIPLPDMQLQFALSLARADGKRLPLLQIELDACKFIEAAYSNQNLAKGVLQAFQRMKDFPRKCPIPAHKAFGMLYFTMRLDFPYPLQRLEFNANVTLLTQHKGIFSVFVRGVAQLAK